jgi:hypothetical protein
MNRRSLYSMLVYLNRCPLERGGGTALFTPPEVRRCTLCILLTHLLLV